MPAELPEDIDAFHALLRRRIRDQTTIERFRAAPSARGQRDGGDNPRARHVVGQTGCFCVDCLLHRKQEWRIGDVNTNVVGPRDHWQQFTWGDASRGSLGAVDVHAAALAPVPTPTVRETVVVHDSRQRRFAIQRDAKFTEV
ncbi:hypothetical protein PINS_up002933 [Pythium insidiosum]|nr:hypothetical protein PINS_up002933 [Pythium insidiosum]